MRGASVLNEGSALFQTRRAHFYNGGEQYCTQEEDHHPQPNSLEWLGVRAYVSG